MLKAEESSAKLHFASASRDRPSHKVPVKYFALRILSVTFLPFTHTIYILITNKSKRGYLWECLFQDTQAQGSRAWMKKKDLVDRALTHRS